MKAPKPKHDPFFSDSMEYLPIARDFFKQHIPPLLVPSIDLSTLERADRKNTDRKLKQRQRDIIYRAILGATNPCFLSCEHQSQERWDMPLRLLQYYLDTLSMYMKAGNRDWPLIISILFYHGEKSPYPHYSESTYYYKEPNLGDQQLYYRFYVVDSTQISDKEIITHGLCAPMEVLLKHGRDGEFELDIDAYREVFRACIEKVGDRYIEAMLTYATSLKDFEIGEKIYTFIEQVLADKRDIAMTYGQKLRKEGKIEGKIEGLEEGVKKGRKETKLEIARGMRSAGYKADEIAKLTGLPLSEINNS
jgi:predicted transposase/invertase (TIGR01784 family)